MSFCPMIRQFGWRRLGTVMGGAAEVWCLPDPQLSWDKGGDQGVTWGWPMPLVAQGRLISTGRLSVWPQPASPSEWHAARRGATCRQCGSLAAALSDALRALLNLCAMKISSSRMTENNGGFLLLWACVRGVSRSFFTGREGRFTYRWRCSCMGSWCFTPVFTLPTVAT